MGTSKLSGNLTKCWGVTCDALASHPGGEAIRLLASCYRNWDKLRQLCQPGSRPDPFFIGSETMARTKSVALTTATITTTTTTAHHETKLSGDGGWEGVKNNGVSWVCEIFHNVVHKFSLSVL